MTDGCTDGELTGNLRSIKKNGFGQLADWKSFCRKVGPARKIYSGIKRKDTGYQLPFRGSASGMQHRLTTRHRMDNVHVFIELTMI